MAGFFEDFGNMISGKKNTDPLSKRGFDIGDVKKFMQLGNELAGGGSDLQSPEKVQRPFSDKRDFASADQVSSLMSLFTTRRASIAQRKAQPGQSQSRIV